MPCDNKLKLVIKTQISSISVGLLDVPIAIRHCLINLINQSYSWTTNITVLEIWKGTIKK